jgi:outer membrane protein OmpA-like peptidoglycan-associated protein
VVTAEGHKPGVLEIVIQPDVVTHAAVVLQPSGPWLDDTRLRTADPIRFALDSADLDDESRETIKTLAAWMRAHPEVRLLRVEGLADALGSPAYNHRLSIRRAESVAAVLVAAGVAAARLEPLGTGEALAEPGQSRDAERSVRFLVIVWDGDAIRASGSPP